jgi:hypothetical protein
MQQKAEDVENNPEGAERTTLLVPAFVEQVHLVETVRKNLRRGEGPTRATLRW